MVREIFKMLNLYAVDNPTLPVNLRFLHQSEILAEYWAVLWEYRAAKYLGHAWYRETFFANPAASSSAHYPQDSNPLCLWCIRTHITTCDGWKPNTSSEPRHSQSGPSTRNSFDPKEGRCSKDYVADQQRLQISDPHCDKFSTLATSACWKIRFKTEVYTCSQFPREAMLWIKEVEMVESVDDLKSSLSVRGIRISNFGSTRCEDCFSTGGTKSTKRGPFPSWKTERVHVRCSVWVGSDLPHTLIDVRQIAASVKVQELCDELLEEL